MTHNNLNLHITKYINEMPSLPVSAAKVVKICTNASANPVDLNYAISLDPVLTGKLLKLINSAYYGLGSQVKSLVRAIIMLGVNTVKNMALSAAVLATLPKNKGIKGLNMDAFWRHCLCVGVTSKLLARNKGVDPMLLEEYFTAGLLHDIGKIPINAVKQKEYLHLISEAGKSGKPLLNTEDSIFHINHCITGGMLTKAWKIEGPIADTVLYHHDPKNYKGDYSDILCTVAIADYFTYIFEIGFAGNKNPEKPGEKIWESSGLKEAAFEEINETVKSEIEKAKVFLSINNI